MPQYLSPGVYIDEVQAGSRPIEGVGTAVAAFVGLAASGPVNKPTLVTNWTQFQTAFGSFVEDSYLAHAVYGFFNNGGGSCYVVRVGGDGASPAAQVALPSATEEGLNPYQITAREEGPPGNEISIEISAPAEGDEDTFDLVVRRGTDEESFKGVTVKGTDQNVATVVNAGSKLVRIEETGRAAVAKRRPAPGTYTLAGGTSAAPAQIGTDDYVGDPAARTGFGGLEEIDDITMLAVPDLMAAYQQETIDLAAVQAVQQAMIDHCARLKDRIAILDAPPGTTPQQVKEWRASANYDSPFAALYWPWIDVFDPVALGNISVPPCGHVAGIWSRNDDTRGVHKAPANEVVRGALDLETQITRPEHDLLNPDGINVIRSFPGRGIRIWGARTLSSDSSWRYLNVRRLFNYIEESIQEGTDWVVFEPNDLDLWQRIRRTVTEFLLRSWRDGALFGATPAQAFYVKCDEETNPPEVVNAGQVVVEIGIAPVKPAEFVVFRIAQVAGGDAQVTE
ncbi:MAG: phage tail sheath family protein [Actinomycetota bacterium]